MSKSPNAEPRRRGVVAVIVRQQRFLVIRRSACVVVPGKYCFPGGGIEGSESEDAALVRELQEELNVEIVPGRRIWRSVTPWQTQLAWWSAQLSDGAVPVANPAEVESIHWWTREEMLREADLLESNRMFLEAMALGDFRWKP